MRLSLSVIDTLYQFERGDSVNYSRIINGQPLGLMQWLEIETAIYGVYLPGFGLILARKLLQLLRRPIPTIRCPPRI